MTSITHHVLLGWLSTDRAGLHLNLKLRDILNWPNRDLITGVGLAASLDPRQTLHLYIPFAQPVLLQDLHMGCLFQNDGCSDVL